jgi:ribulose-phosphate 3-epimerase
MSVNPGFGGQSFIPQTLVKARAVRRRIDEYRSTGGQAIALEIDGGVKTGNIAAVAAAGVDTFVVGSALFGEPDPDGGYRTIVAALRRELAASPHPGAEP